MNKMLPIYILLFMSAYLLTAAIKWYALKSSWLDIPNERSSHSMPIARGGGIAFVLTFMIALVGYGWSQGEGGLMTALLLMSLTLSTIGWLDDRFHLSALTRLIVQLISSSIALYYIGFFHQFGMGIVSVLGVLYLTGLINVFNFLDGIDGYAVMEASFVSMGMGIFSAMSGFHVLGGVLGCYAAAILGFGVWNFPKAKIFMGDVGSGFLGGVLGICSLYGDPLSLHEVMSWMMMMGLFIVDASVTLFIRALRQERVWESHRQHAYQHVALLWGSHVKVTLAGLGINLGWLLPWSVLVWYQICPAIVGGGLAYLPLLILAVYMGAGQKKAK